MFGDEELLFEKLNQETSRLATLEWSSSSEGHGHHEDLEFNEGDMEASKLYADADEALDEAASILRALANERLDQSLPSAGRDPHSTRRMSSPSLSEGHNPPDIEPAGMHADAARPRDATGDFMGQLTELLQDAEEVTGDFNTDPDLGLGSLESLICQSRSLSPVPARPDSLQAADAHEPHRAQVATPSPSKGHLWRLGKAAAADVWQSSESGSDARSAASLDISGLSDSIVPDLPTCESGQSPQMPQALQSVPSSPEAQAAIAPEEIHQEPIGARKAEAADEPQLRQDPFAEAAAVDSWSLPIKVPSLRPPSPLLPQSEPADPQPSLAQSHAGESEKNAIIEGGSSDADAARQGSGVVGDNATAKKDDDPGVAEESSLLDDTYDLEVGEQLSEDIELQDFGAAAMVEQEQYNQDNEDKLPEESTNSSDSDERFFLPDQLPPVKPSAPQHAAAVVHAAHKALLLQGQSQVATRPMGQEESTPSAALAQELATMQDIAEGLQHSQHFNNTSQALKRDIAAMCESLSAFNAGKQHVAAAEALDGGRATSATASANQEELQDLPAFLTGLRAKYGLAECRPLLLQTVAHAQVPGQQQDAACTVTQQPSLASIKAEGTRFGTSEKQRKEAALAGPGEAPHYSPNQGGAKSASEPHATVTSGAASNAQVQPSLGDEASHTEAQAQQISLAEDCSDTFSESSADAAWDRGPQPQPPAAPNWRDLNQLLCHSGFSALPDAGSDGEAAAALAGALAAVLREYARRSKLAEEMLAAVEHGRARDRSIDDALARLNEEHARQMKRAEAAARNLRREVEEARRAAAQAEADNRGLESEMSRLSRELAAVKQASREMHAAKEECSERASCLEAEQRAARQRERELEERVRAAESRAAAVRTAASQAEHSSRAHEAAAAKLRERLAAKVKLEERRLQRDAHAHSRIKHALAAHRGNPKAGSAAGAVSAAVRELRPLEIVGLYESQRENLETELAVLRAEVRTLLEQLRDSQNQLAILASGRPSGVSDNAPRRIAAMSKAATQAQASLEKERASAAEAARVAARRVAEAERRAEALAEENASLVLQLNARPTVKAFGALKRQLEALERQLAAQQRSAHPDGFHPHDTISPGVARARRDREVHAAGLEAVEELAHAVLVDTVQQLCLVLGSADATALPERAAGQQRALAALPRLERFVTDVCEVVFRRGKEFMGEAAEDPAAVPQILERWVGAQQELRECAQTLTELHGILQQRQGADVDVNAHLGKEEVVAQVAELVQLERQRADAAETIAAAQGLAQANAEALLHRIVAHFQHLFAVEQLEGVLPAMNQVYVAYTEGQNVRRAMAELLGLESTASIASCMQCLTHLMSSRHANDEGEAVQLHAEERQGASPSDNVLHADATEAL